ncbi:MAG: hypothetical protein EBZ77_10545, partial [Chitinophagia bacterium]|nr:hypothetical protein [Chitinophagia bacterium]
MGQLKYLCIMKLLLYCVVFTGLLSAAHAQESLFGVDSSIKAHKGFILTGNVSFDVPQADMAKRFGNSYRVGPAILYKTTSNWLFGAKFDFLLGNRIKEDSLLINVRDKYNTSFNGRIIEMLNVNGERTNVTL